MVFQSDKVQKLAYAFFGLVIGILIAGGAYFSDSFLLDQITEVEPIESPPTELNFSEIDEAKIKEFAIKAIREQPEIIREAFDLLRAKETAAKASSQKAVLATYREKLESGVNAYVLGNPEGDVTVVEFFDYNCPYCKKAADNVRSLIKQDEQVRVVFRELPILGKGSAFAARAALAARKQGKYERLHWALMSQPRVSQASVLKVAAKIGIDIDQLKRDMRLREVNDHIALSMDLTRNLDLNGTPTFIIGDRITSGLLPLQQMLTFVSEARTAKLETRNAE